MARTNVRLNGPIAAIVITAMVLLWCTWLALCITKTLPWQSGLTLLSYVFAYGAGGATPLTMWWKDKGIDFSAASDPPKEGVKDDAKSG